MKFSLYMYLVKESSGYKPPVVGSNKKTEIWNYREKMNCAVPVEGMFQDLIRTARHITAKSNVFGTYQMVDDYQQTVALFKIETKILSPGLILDHICYTNDGICCTNDAQTIATCIWSKFPREAAFLQPPDLLSVTTSTKYVQEVDVQIMGYAA